MKNNFLPFYIGEQYDRWEFELEVVNYERIPFYDRYLYIGDVKKFLNFLPQKTELIFYWDRLEIVILTFLNMGDATKENFMKKFKLECKLSIPYQYVNCEIYELKNSRLKLYFVSRKISDTTLVIYGNPNYIKEVYLNILAEI